MKAYGLVALTAMVGLAATLGVVACSDDGDLGGGGASSGTSGGGTSSGNPSGTSGGTDNTRPEESVEGDITASRTLTKDKNWLLKGLVRVQAGATLTIEAGTIIKGDNATKAILAVLPGAKIEAKGTADEPIVFTSQAKDGSKKAGDWGGLVLLGKAKTNWPGGVGNVEGIDTDTPYGGTDDDDSSGTLQYVRVEYSGILLTKDNEVNGITFAGVGRGTTVDHVQVRHTLDDCFEFFGGTVNAKYLACQHNQDDGFDFDYGYRGKLQFLVLQQDPNHEGEDNGVESDNNAEGEAREPMTSPTVYNLTLCGKNKVLGSQQYGLLLRKNTRGTYKNLVVTGFQAALDIRNSIGTGEGALTITNSLVWGNTGAGANYTLGDNIAFVEDKTSIPDGEDEKTYKARLDWNDDDGADEVTWFKGLADNTFDADPGIAGCFNATAPVFGPTTSLSAGAAPPPNDGFFDASATYKGAFKDANDTWATTGKWAVWSAN